MTLAQKRFDVRLNLIDLIGRNRLYIDTLNVSDAEHAFLCGRERNVNNVILILPKAGASLRR